MNRPTPPIAASPRVATRGLGAALLLFLAPVAGLAGEMKTELKFDAASLSAMRTTFATYGYTQQRPVNVEAGTLRFRLPAGVPSVPQTGIYSLFSLSGDCEVSFAYELTTMAPPKEGYGCSVGLAFDAGDDIGRAVFQRAAKNDKEIGYILQIMPGKNSKLKEEYQFVSNGTKKGRIALRRVKKELIFLAVDEPDGIPEQIGSLPFTEGTVRAVRFFADQGGSQLAVDARLRNIQLQAEQITGGIPKSEVVGWRWWWLLGLVPVAGAGLVIWRWRVYRRNADG